MPDARFVPDHRALTRNGLNNDVKELRRVQALVASLSISPPQSCLRQDIPS